MICENCRAAMGVLSSAVERRPYKANVVGSIPSAPTTPLAVKGSHSFKRGAVVQLVRIPACHAGGRGFESRPLRHFYEDARIERGPEGQRC
jgi:hypothetical protein